MAYFSSILTRYKENASDTDNQSYTASDDNINAQVSAHSTLSYELGTNNKQINVTGLTQLDLSADLIVFDKTFKFTATDAKLTGPAESNTDTDNNDGFHGYFANCVFIFDAATTENSGNTRRAVLGSEGYDWRQLREVDIPTDRSGKSAWHFYNCKFIWNDAATTGIVHGDVYDCTQICANPGMGDTVLYPMGGAITENFYSDFSVFDSVSGTYQGYFAQYAKPQGEISGLSLQNQYLYPILNSDSISFPLLSAQQNILYSASSGGTPSNPPIIRLGEFSNTLSAALLPSPQVDPRPNGAVWWRNARNLSEGGSQCRVIPSRRLVPRFYKDVNQTQDRENVKYTFTTDVSYTTAGDALSIAVASTDATYTYESTNEGVLIGTFDFTDGSVSVSNQKFETIDVPIGYLEAEEGLTDNDFSTVQLNHSTTLERVSLFGQLNDSITIDSTNWAADQAAADADGGYWIPYDNDPIVDLDDEYMVNYEDTEAIINIADNGGVNGGATISPNDVYALYKYGVYNADITLDDYPYSSVSNNVFDMSGLGVHDLTVSNLSSNNPIGIDDDEIRIHCAGIADKSDDVITGLKVENLGLGGNPIETNVETTSTGSIHTFRQYDTELASFDATDTDTFSAKAVTIDGNVNVTRNSGTRYAAVFRDVEWGDNATVRRTPGQTGDVDVYLTGTTPASGVTFTNIANVYGLVQIDVTFGTALTNGLTDVDALFYSSADGSTFTSLTATASINSDNTVVTYVVLYDPTVSGNQVYFSVLGVQHEMVSGITTTDTSVTSATIPTSSMNQAFTPVADSDDEILLSESDNAITVDLPASATGSFNVTSSYTTAGITATNTASRRFMRRIELTSNYRQGVAQGYIPADFFKYTSEGIEFLSQTEADRITFRRSAADTIWNLEVRVFLSDPPKDLYKQLSTGTPRTYIEFLQSTDGVSGTEVQSIIDALELSVKGSDDRDITQAYKEAKRAKNAAFI